MFNKNALYLAVMLLTQLALVPLPGQDTLVQSLSDGGCWYEQNEVLKVVSFNDQQVFQVPREGLEEALAEMLSAKARSKLAFSKNSVELFLHCAGNGASLVVKADQYCAWLQFKGGALEVRSLGGREDLKSQGLCDGLKWNELLVGVKKEDDALFKRGAWATYVATFERASAMLYKVVLKDEYRGREAELAHELRKLDANVRYIELNQYQHPVGEFAPLK